MKFKILIPFLVFVFLFSTGTGLVYWYFDSIKSVSTSNSKVRFVINKGASAGQVSNKLYQNGLIRSPLAFKIYLQLTNNTKVIKPGEFTLEKNMDVATIVAKLLKGPDELWVTIPEGLRREEVVNKIVDQLEINDPGFRIEFLSLTKNLEGYLFPDSYLFPKDVTAEKVVKVLTDNFEKNYTEAVGSDTQRSKAEIVIMASIIERETKINTERPVVAGILWKRLDTDGWLIQADASVQYAIGSANCKDKVGCNWWPILTKEDLGSDSLYNTYKYKSLPPAPIANPGRESLSAAAHPESSQYWFYIHDKDAVIHYAADLAGHNANIAKYLGK